MRDPVSARAVAPEPPWKRKKRAAIFEGDVAVKELRARLALAPDQIPEPLPHKPGGSMFAVVARLIGVMVLAAGGALGFLWMTAPRAAPPEGPVTDQAGEQTGGQMGRLAVAQTGGQLALVSYRKPEALELPVTTETLKADRAPAAPAGYASWSVGDHVRDLTDGAGTTSAVPAPRALPAAETRIAPLPAPPSAVTAPEREEIAALLARGRAYIAEGDVAAARLVLRRAVERGDPQAALALGGTYDPIVLKRLAVTSFLADPAQARDWYRKAAELGSADAPLRLEQLAQIDR